MQTGWRVGSAVPPTPQFLIIVRESGKCCAMLTLTRALAMAKTSSAYKVALTGGGGGVDGGEEVSGCVLVSGELKVERWCWPDTTGQTIMGVEGISNTGVQMLSGVAQSMGNG